MAKDLDTYLKECARLAGTTKDDVLRQVLHIGGESALARTLFPNATAELLGLFEELDYAIKLRNPGFHYVRRTQFLGYRREAMSSQTPLGERSQIFVSVITGRSRGGLQVLLPVEPTPYLKLDQVTDLRGVGHHGIGELRFNVTGPADLSVFMRTFDGWLNASRDSS
jgi:hypothetical protein